MVERHPHRAHGAFSIRGRRSHVMRIGGEAVTGQLAINFRAAGLRVLELFDDENAGAFAHDETVPVAIERARRALRLVVARAQRLHRGKTGKADRDDRRFGAAREEDVGVAEFNHAPRFADRVV